MIYLLPNTIEQAAEQVPEQEAIRFGQESLAYAELAMRVSQLAYLLNELGVQRGDRVGIYMNKCLASAIALYGIMKAGAVYVPLDPAAPIDRLKTIISDCGIRHLITNESMQIQLHALAGSGAMVDFVIGLQTLAVAPIEKTEMQGAWTCVPVQTIYEMPEHKQSGARLTEDDLAYILYTSGSTGKPKGIMHTHRSGLSFANWAAQTFDLRVTDRVSNHAPLHFDLSTFDFFATAVAGATTVIIPEPYKKMPASLSKLMADEALSVWYSVPFALIQLLERGGLEARNLERLRWVLFAGEVFPLPSLRMLMGALPDARFSNLYGPTETNVCTYYHVPRPLEALQNEKSLCSGAAPMDTLPIGRTCENAEALFIDEKGHFVATGEEGELAIGGDLLMAGYWGREDLNRCAFYTHPTTGKQFYRTGDLVRYRPDGNIDFLGRRDRQIKIRGYRVELDEIENALMAHPEVVESAVFLLSDGDAGIEGQQIRAVVTLKTQKTNEKEIEDRAAGEADVQQAEEQTHTLVQTNTNDLLPNILTSYISQKLPWYAIPSEIRIAPEMPRTSTGKLDRRALHAQQCG